jgi:hypothetical protein
LEGFIFASILDLNMGIYTIWLDPDQSKISTIISPWGKYSYLGLLRGIAGSPDIIQAKVSVVMRLRDNTNNQYCHSANGNM